MLLERDWKEEAMIYSNQIKLIKNEIERDNKLRKIEAKKKEKDEEYLKSMKLSERKRSEHQKIAAAHDRVKKEGEDKIFQQNIDKLVSEAKSLEREYNLAIKKGDFQMEPPFEKIIEIYESVKEMLIEKGWAEQSVVYIKQINLIKLKWENDKNLREIEAKKKERDKEFQESFKLKRDEEFDVQKMSMKEDKYRQKVEDKEFQSIIAKMSSEAEKLERSYELEIKKGKFETEPPFNKIINIYSEIKEMLQKKGWLDQASVYSNQIKITLDKMAHDEKLRDMEAKKKVKDKEFLESFKVKKEDEIDIEKTRITEEKLKRGAEDEIFQQQIDLKVTDAEKIIKTYEREIKKGKFNTEPPYQKVIEIYEVIKNQLLERKWNEQAIIYSNQIKFYEERKKKDERLREIEAQKVQKQKEYEDLRKVKASDKEIKADLDKLEEIKVQYQVDIEEEEFENRIIMMTDKAEKLVQRYELELRKGNFDERCIYPDVINIYENVQKLLIDHSWNQEARLYNNQIELYTQKLEQDQKLRAIEEVKVQKQKVYDDFYKRDREQEVLVKDQEKLKGVEDKYLREKEEEIFEHKITEMVTNAEEMARRYEFAIRKGNFEEKPPYEEIIQIYKNIKTQLLEKNWQEQSRIYSNQIKLYEEKLEKDKKLRGIEAQKTAKEQQFEDMFKSQKEDTGSKARIIEKLEIRKKEEEELSDRAFELIDNAEKMVKNYELDLKKDILSRESPYDEVITLYKKSRKLFIENGWNDEASRLITTIKFYNDKKDKDDKLRAYEIKKLEKQKARSVITMSKPSSGLAKRKQQVMDLEQKKKVEEDSSSEALHMIDEAERLVKKYELNLKAGIFPDSPYNQVITIYRQAKERFEEIGWSDQASGLIGTINFYKQKLNADNRLRALEAEKIEKQRIENEERERIFSSAQKREQELLQQKHEALLLKNREESVIEEKKDAAFRLMDRAKRELNQNNFDEAIRLYTQSDTIFSDINWSDGRNMIQDSIIVIKKKKQEHERQTLVLRKEEEKRLKLEEKLEEKIDKTKDLKQIELKQKRKDLAKIQQQKGREKEISENAYNLLEQGTKLIRKKKFSEAYEKYESARDMFQQIEWHQEVIRINNELLVKLKKEEVKFLKFKEYEKKKLMEEKELERLLTEAEQQKEVTAIANRKEKRKLLGKAQISERLRNKIEESLERADIIIQNYKYNEGILKLKEIIEMMKRIGGEKEIIDINQRIQTLIDKSLVPLPVTEDFEINEINDRFKSAYEALDKAQVSLINNQNMKAISELNEAKFNLKESKIGQKYIEQIDNTIGEFRGEIEKRRSAKEISGIKEMKKKKEEIVELSSELAYEYMEKCKEEQKNDNFDKAIELATLSVEIFHKLGSEWSEEKSTVEKHIVTLETQKVARENLFKRKKKELEQQEEKLKQEEDEFKSRIAARREARRKKIQKLMEK